MLEIKKSENLKEVFDLYKKSFPEDEQMNFEDLSSSIMDGEMFSIYWDSIFAGFISMFNVLNITHILYFAIDENYQDKGIGSATLQWLKEYKSDSKILADLEEAYPCENYEQRIARKHFYEKNGFHKSNTHYSWKNERYDIYVCNGTITDEEFWDFWKTFIKRKQDD